MNVWLLFNIVLQYLDIDTLLELKKDVTFKSLLKGNTIKELSKNEDWRNWKYNLNDLLETFEKNEEYRYYIRLSINKLLIKELKTDLTSEQREVENIIVKPKKWYTIQAYAGTGKTTVLSKISKSNIEKSTLYLAFNKSLEKEARTGKLGKLENTKCYTFHSYVLEDLQERGEIDAEKIINEYKCLQIKKHFRNLTYYKIKCMINEINKFFQSDDTHPKKPEVQKLWDYIRGGIIPYTHDAYLKLYEILQIKMDFDIILLDEAQDTTICMLSILKKSRAAKILVGDGHQQIYGFRGSVNPFELIKDDAEKKYYLSNTFRFGNEICEMVNLYMETFVENFNVKMKTSNTYDSKIYTDKSMWLSLNEKKACLFFSNKGLYEFAFKEVENGTHVNIIGNEVDFEKESFIIRDFIRIENGEEPINSELKELTGGLMNIEIYFASIGEKEWVNRFMMYRTFGSQLTMYYDMLNKYERENADIILSTIHKSKGLEFDHVLLGEDFPTISKGLKESTVNCVYVALTRAKKTLTLNKMCGEWYKKQIVKMRFYKEGRKNTCRICGKLTTLLENNIPICHFCI